MRFEIDWHKKKNHDQSYQPTLAFYDGCEQILQQKQLRKYAIDNKLILRISFL